MKKLILLLSISSISLFAQQNIKGTYLDEIEQISNVQDSKYIIDAYAYPLVHIAEKGTFSYFIKVNNLDIKLIKIYLGRWKGKISYLGNPLDTLTFYNDGTHNDEIAGDSLFTIGLLKLSNYNQDYPINGIFFRYLDVFYQFKDGTIISAVEDIELNEKAIWKEFIKNISITRNGSVQYTEYVFNTIAQIKGIFPKLYVSPTPISNQYYDYFPDDRDYLIMVYFFNTSREVASYHEITNSIEGIGLDSKDWSDYYGSNGKLRGTINSYRGLLSLHTLNHEILHNYAVFTDETLDLNYGPHWGPVEMESSGFGSTLAGDEILQVNDSTYQVTQSESFNNSYSSLELYLMGYGSLEEISFPIKTLANSIFIGYVDNIETFKADSIKHITKNQFIETLGPRIPDYNNSQKTYKIGIIVPYNRLLTDIEMKYCDFIAREYEKRSSVLGYYGALTFYEATKQRGNLVSQLPEPQNPFYSKPIITEQPKNIIVNEGETATFKVTATCIDSTGYQWWRVPYVNSGSKITNIPGKIEGAQTSQLKILNTTTSDNNTSYLCEVYNTVDHTNLWVNSDTATLIVLQLPKLEISSGSLTHNFGNIEEGNNPSNRTYTFTIKNSGGNILTGKISTSISWLSINDSSFSLTNEQTKTITVTATTTNLTLGSYSGTISITSNGGDMEGTVSSIITDVNDLSSESEIPDHYYLSNNYPNPFNPSTKINFGLPEQSTVSLVVYEITGKVIEEFLRNEQLPAGLYSYTFNASNLSSGIYFYRLQAGDFVQTKKLILMK